VPSPAATGAIWTHDGAQSLFRRVLTPVRSARRGETVTLDEANQAAIGPAKCEFVTTYSMIDLSISLRQNLISLPGGAHKFTALYDLSGRRVDDTNIVVTSPDRKIFAKEYARAPERIQVPDELEVIDDEVMYMGVARDHYGHFLLDSMSRMWAAINVRMPCVFLGAQDMNGCTGFFEPIMSSFNAQIISPDRPTLYRNIWVPSPSLTENQIAENADIAHLQVTERLHQRATGKWNQPVFLSRVRLNSKARTYTTDKRDEDRLEHLIEQAGYRIVDPQDLTFSEQIALFNECPKIVGLLGSAFHTSLFSRKSFDGNLALLTFRPEVRTKRYGLIDSIKGYLATYIKCCEIDLAKRTMAIDVDHALASLIDRGFIN